MQIHVMTDLSKKRKSSLKDTHDGIKKTTRMIRSCTTCKKRKVKCNFEIPCDRCILRNEASTCTRERVIVNGYLVDNKDTKELKFSQENEILKSKIKELQDTILKMKTEISSVNSVSLSESDKLSDVNTTVPLPPSRNKHVNIRLISDSNWSEYSSTISSLKKGLASGVIFDNTETDLYNFDYNTEEWLSLKTNKYLEIEAEDIKAKCWLYELSKVKCIKRSTCDVLVQNGLKFSYLYNTFDKDYFMKFYNEYWDDESVPDKHISELYTKPASTYIFLGFMYSLMCLGLYHCTEEQLKQENISDEDCDTLSKGLFSVVLECLYRGRFLQHPHFFSLQTISILRILACFLGGNVLFNNLFCISSFIAKKLNLEESENYLKRNTFWNFLQNDWFDDHDRYPLTTPKTYESLPLPQKWLQHDKKLLNWDNFYLLFSISASKIKNKYYMNESEITLDLLKKADMEWRILEVETFRDIDSFSTKDYPNTPEEQIQIIKVHTTSHIYVELLQVNCMMSAFLMPQQWFDMCYYTCYYSANEVIDLFLSNEYPIQMKIYAFIIDHVTYACVFLLVDCLLRNLTLRKQKKITIKAFKVLSIFKSFKCTITGTIRGTYVINKLIQLLNKKNSIKKSNNLTKENYRKATHSSSLSNENNLDKDAAVLSEESSNEESEEELEGTPDDENDMPLYYSTISDSPNQMAQPTPSQVHEPIAASTTFDEVFTNTSIKKSEIHNTIMDILEDSGWSKFLTSLDDLS